MNQPKHILFSAIQAFGAPTLLSLSMFLLNACVKDTSNYAQQFSRLPNPEVDFLHAMPTAVKGGTTLDLQFESKSTSVLGVQYQLLEVSIDGGTTFSLLAKLNPQETVYQWSVPTLNITTAVIKLSAFDKLGYSSSQQSPVFSIYTTAPTFTEKRQNPSVANALTSLPFGGDCENPYPIQVQVTRAGVVISKTQLTCTNAQWNYSAVSNLDGILNFRFTQSDFVGNITTVNRAWTRDTAIPVLTQDSVVSPVINVLDQVVFGGSCETGLNVSVAILPSTTAVSQIPCVLGAWSYTATASSDGVRTYQFSETDAVGNAAPVINVSWTRDTDVPVLTQTAVVSPVSNSLNQVTFGGDCETGLNVSVVLLPSTTPIAQILCAQNAWTYTATGALDGTRNYRFSETDAAGNAATPINVTWTRDTGAPILTQTLAISPLTNNLNQVTYGGACETGLTVQVLLLPSTNPVAQVVCSANSWSYTASASSDGTRNYQFSESDAVGNSATPIYVSWTRSTVVPILTQTLVTSPVTNNLNQVTFGGACQTGLIVKVAFLPSTTTSAQVTCASSSWSYTATATTDGTRSYQFSEADSVGNAATPITVSWTRSTGTPILTQTLVASPVTNGLNQVTFGGACQTGLTVQVSLLPSTTSLAQIPCASSSWSYTASATTDASRTYQFSESDPVGNTAPTLTATWIRDTVVPVLTQTSVVSPVTNSLNQVVFGGACETGLTVQVALLPSTSPIAQVVCASSSWSYTASSTSDGTRNYQFSESDAAGNAAPNISVTWTRDTNIPVLTQILLTSPVVNNLNSVTFGGACETGLNVQVALLPSTTPISQVACAAGSWNYTASATSDASRSYQFSELDGAGNAASPITVVWTRDTSAPTLTQTLVTSPVVNKLSQVTFGGACQTGLNVQVALLPSTSPITQVVCSGSSWSYTASVTSDGSRTYQFSESDAAGNAAPDVSAIWVRDTTAPVLTQNLVPSPATNSFNQILFGGACETGLTVNIALLPSTTAIAQMTCASGAWSYTASASTDASRTYQFSETDAVGNTAPTVNATWVRDTEGPVFTQTLVPDSSISNAASLTVGGACDSSVAIVASLATPAGNLVPTLVCRAGTWTYSIIAGSGVSGQGNFELNATQTDAAGNATQVKVSWARDFSAPIINSFVVANGATSTISNYIPVHLTATDASTNITHFCLSYTSTSTPSISDACWIAVNNPDQPNLIPALTLNLQSFSYRVGYSPGTYTITAWVHDLAGNISAPMAKSIVYAPGTPPSVINVIAANTDSPTLPLSVGETMANQDTPVYIFWKIASAANGLGSQPVQILSTNDDVNYNLIATVANTGNGGCTADVTRASGCYVWNSTFPVNTYFRIRVLVTDNNGMVTAVSTNPMNSNGLASIAGNTDSGFGASATSAMFVNSRIEPLVPDIGSMVITKDGFIFFRDENQGIVYMSPTDGVIKMLLPLRPSNPNSFEGALSDSRASGKSISKIALDYQNGLLLYDFDRIRRIDLKNWTISTLIGGGSSSSDNVGPKQVQFSTISCCSRQESQIPLIPLPNGDILFQSDQYNSMPGRLRFFHNSTQTVTSIAVSGSGHGQINVGSNVDSDGSVDVRTENLNCSKTTADGNVPCNRSSYSVEFDPISSQLTTIQVVIMHAVNGDVWYPTANLTPTGPNIGVSLAPHPPPPVDKNQGVWRPVGRDGKIYVVNKGGGQILRFNKATNSWVKLAGLTKPGTCVDGTAALSCAMQPTDLFVDAQSNVFFIDRGRIRTIDGRGKVVTVFGQSFYFGDGGLAISARFNSVPSLDLINPNTGNPNGRVVILDQNEFRLREFSIGGNIQTIAGNGTADYSDYVTVANAQPYSTYSSGVDFVVFATDPVTGNVYSSRNTDVARLNRSSGLWESMGTSSAGTRYPPNILGYNGTNNILVHGNNWDPNLNLKDVFLDFINISNKFRTGFAGSFGATLGNFTQCPDGVLRWNCVLPPAYGNGLSAATYDSGNTSTPARWLVTQYGTSAIRILPTELLGTVGTLARLNRNISSFAYLRSGSSQSLYYCDVNNGRLYKQVIGGAETALDWRINSMSCKGYSLKYSASLNSLIFPYVQKGLYGIGQYWLP